MLTPKYLEKCSKEIVELYTNLETSLIRDIARRIASADYQMTESAKWQIQVAQMSGLTYDEVLTRVANNTDLSKKELKKLFENSAVEALEYDNEIYKQAGLNPIPIKQDKNLLKILTAGLAKTNNAVDNLCMTTANFASSTVEDTLNKAYMQVISGGFDYNTVIRNTIKDLASSGITAFEYTSGRQMKLESAVKMNVITGVQQTMGRVSLAHAEDMGCDLVEVTAHGGARPDHASWQGKIFSISGKHKKYKSLKDETDYGTVTGLKGANCRHDFFPYIEGISRPAYTEKELEEYNAKNIEYNCQMYTEYEATQLQRKMERNIRANKREIAGLEGAIQGTKDEVLKQDLFFSWNKQKDKLKEKQNILSDLIMPIVLVD